MQEHKPNTSEVAAQLADDYLQARKSHPLAGSEERKVRPLSQIVCAKCKEEGHKAKDCRVNPDGNDGIKIERTRRDLKDITCFTCNQKGHYSANCPSKTNLLCLERQSDFQGDSELMESPKPGVFQEGRIEGRTVSDVWLDTGCTRTMVRQDLVPANKLIEGDSIAICCAHGDIVVYPLARVEVEVNGQIHEVEAAVSDTLPMSMLMGTDMPALPRLVTNKLGDALAKKASDEKGCPKTQEDIKYTRSEEYRRKDGTSNGGFVRKKGLLYRRWFPRWRIKPGRE